MEMTDSVNATTQLMDDSELAQDPFPLYAQWREAGPIQHALTPSGDPVWLVTRYADVVAAFGDDRLSLSKTHSGTGYRGFALPPALDANLLSLDPPDHTRLRKLVNREFTARRVENLRADVVAIADDLLATMNIDTGVDLVQTYAVPLPLTVIGRLLGVPDKDQPDFRAWTTSLMSPASAAEAKSALGKIEAFLRELIGHKRRTPGDDLLAGLVAAHDGGDCLSEDELTSLAFLLLWAGYEVTVDLIGVSTLELLRRPALWATVREQPERLPQLVEELVRVVSPTPVSIRRFAREPLTIGGTDIPRGATVMLLIAAAHRDPARFDAPDTLDPDRDVRAAQLGFGYGVHYCLGAPLARMETAVALHRLATRFPHLALDPESPPQWRPSWRSRGLLTLPVVPHTGE
ncbi:cytochrome P450 family protein [Catenuloplanes japonicus]|uniref:cytochrome P450 family protein n=1 Tax=Catenuloplanes japonicus TaxID=33876 RepID=UPI0005273B39|nr:cytochrome P450 [Catenuloplanes japonicus]